MNSLTSLRIVFAIAILGFLFSGYLSYDELFRGAEGCPAIGDSGVVFGYPACVYGFFMYATLVLVSGIGIFSKGK